jgi:hypothetical protein
MDQKSTDKGWASMRSLLDREMPEKRRRRFAWWWFCLLLLPIAGYGGWHFGGNSTKKEAIPEQTTTQPASIVDAQANPIKPVAPISILAGTETPKTSEKSSQAKSTATTSSPAFNTQTKPSRSRSFKPFSEQITEKGFAASPPESQRPLATAPIPVSENSVALASNYPLDLLPITAQIVDNQVETAINTPKTYLTQTIQPTRKESYSKWAFGATTNIATERFKTINGFSTGATVDWKFARKWGLRSGLAYNIHSPQEESRPVASVQSNYYTDNVGGAVVILDIQTGVVVQGTSSSFYNDSLSGNVLIPVNRLQRLEVPVTAFWQPVRPLKVIGGFSFTRTLVTQSDNQNYTQDYILKLVDQKAEDGASKLSSSELGHWSADAMFGLGLKLGRSFELGCSVKMPLNKFSGLSPKESRSNNAGFGSLGDEVRSTRKQSGPVFSLSGTLFF